MIIWSTASEMAAEIEQRVIKQLKVLSNINSIDTPLSFFIPDLSNFPASKHSPFLVLSLTLSRRTHSPVSHQDEEKRKNPHLQSLSLQRPVRD